MIGYKITNLKTDHFDFSGNQGIIDLCAKAVEFAHTGKLPFMNGGRGHYFGQCAFYRNRSKSKASIGDPVSVLRMAAVSAKSGTLVLRDSLGNENYDPTFGSRELKIIAAKRELRDIVIVVTRVIKENPKPENSAVSRPLDVRYGNNGIAHTPTAV